MKKLLKMLSLTMLLILSIGCQRKELEDPYQFLAHIPISIDWSESLVDVDDVAHVSIYLYPSDGGEPLTYLSADIYFNLIQVPIGEYSVLIFNDLVDNVKGVGFDGVSSYTNHSVNAVEDLSSTTSYYNRADNERLLTEHSRMASWYLDELIVDESMVEYTRSDAFEVYIEDVRSKSKSKSKSESESKSDGEGVESRSDDDVIPLPESKSEITKSTTKAIEELSNVVTQPETSVFDVRVRVYNLNASMYFKAIVKGTASGSYLSNDGKITHEGLTNIYYLEIDNQEYDDPDSGVDGYVNFTLNNFGRVATSERYYIDFCIIQKTGVLKEFVRDVTDQVVASDSAWITIDLTDELNAIMLDEYTGGGFSVDGWDDDEVVYL
ncbi:MAG: DUF5119 domain-containing protein [Rikenellaceae bacterium]